MNVVVLCVCTLEYTTAEHVTHSKIRPNSTPAPQHFMYNGMWNGIVIWLHQRFQYVLSFLVTGHTEELRHKKANSETESAALCVFVCAHQHYLQTGWSYNNFFFKWGLDAFRFFFFCLSFTITPPPEIFQSSVYVCVYLCVCSLLGYPCQPALLHISTLTCIMRKGNNLFRKGECMSSGQGFL